MYKLLIISQVFILLQFSAFAQKTYYVSTSGNDNNDGLSEITSFATPNKAVSIAVAGDMIWVKGGIYMITATVKPSKAGTSTNPIKMWAMPGEVPVFNCQPLIDAGKTSNAGRGMEITKDWWHIKGITVCNTNDRGITLSATNIKLEGITVHHANNDGIAFMAGCTDALVLNCDSYFNWERTGDGNNGDGFAAKAGNTGNVFRGCRAWFNSDDGWDVYGGSNPVLIDSCWSMCNGYNVFGYAGTWKGNGNGFKLGGSATNAQHTVTNCIAFNNASKGFDQNHATMGQTLLNCTGYNNRGANGNFSFYETPTAGTLMHHVLKNNLSYKGLTHYLDATTEQLTNSWNLGIIITDNDFVSLDTMLAWLPRTDNYRLQETGFLRLKPGSNAINAGTNIGFPYSGTFPDLGAFEFFENITALNTLNKNEITCYPTNFKNQININFYNPLPGKYRIFIYNSAGKILYSNYYKTSYSNSIYRLNTMQYPKGIYFIRVSNGNISEIFKIIKTN